MNCEKLWTPIYERQRYRIGVFAYAVETHFHHLYVIQMSRNAVSIESCRVTYYLPLRCPQVYNLGLIKPSFEATVQYTSPPFLGRNSSLLRDRSLTAVPSPLIRKKGRTPTLPSTNIFTPP